MRTRVHRELAFLHAPIHAYPLNSKLPLAGLVTAITYKQNRAGADGSTSVLCKLAILTKKRGVQDRLHCTSAVIIWRQQQ